MVIGIDFGNNTCYISVARTGGIETIDNDYSLRETPSYVGYGERKRIIGVGAKNQLLTNLQKTVFGFKHLLGRKYNDPVVQENITDLPYLVSEGKGGNILIHVKYLGADNAFTPEQITAMLFTKLKHTAENSLKTKVKDVVISCPSYFTDSERKALLSAGSIAGLNILKLMNDTTAIALAYGFYKRDLPPAEENPRNVVFVDVGHIGIQAAACSFHNGKLVMKSSFHAREVGGRSFDSALVKHFATEFSMKTGLDPLPRPRALLKLTTEVEKVKKQMSANTNVVPLNIECFMDEKDFAGKVDRSRFDTLIKTQIAIIEDVLQKCLKSTEWGNDDIYAVEIVGGSTRIPAIKIAIEKVFGKIPSTTLNADEAVSRGCAIQCAFLSPSFKVREFSLTDIQPYPIKISWESNRSTDHMIVFEKFHQVPFCKLLTFSKKSDFCCVAEYAKCDEMSEKADVEKEKENAKSISITNPFIGSYTIGNITPNIEGGNQKVKVKVLIDHSGIFNLPSASVVEKVEIEEEVPMEVDNDVVIIDDKKKNEETKKEETNKEVNNSQIENGNLRKHEKGKEAGKQEKQKSPKMTTQKKIVDRNIHVPVTSNSAISLSTEDIEKMSALETRFTYGDVEENERIAAKNEVEEYIYAIRERTHDSTLLDDAENWLYDDGNDCDKPVYIEKLRELKIFGNALISKTVATVEPTEEAPPDTSEKQM